ncbi:MAG: hypothetical protein J0I20_26910 [Chloroflexi bacterium]|nr:hypothetical protein [Chloroflexota bacterium]OJV99221.1 MAG: hypothetical protein BGO39_17310 [Chloroflexi bacterium 54-19]
MVKVGFNLAQVLSPLDLSRFFNEYWEQTLLYIPRENPAYYAELLSMSDMDRIIATFGLRAPSLRLVKNGESIPLAKYTYNMPWGGDSFSRVIDSEVVFSEFYQGATVVMQALHTNFLPLALFCRNLETFFNYPVQTNIYMTPKHSQGFSAHYDTHDVFVLQVAGAKRWRVYEGALKLPDRSQAFKKTETAPGKLLFDQELKAGDMLYLPRGFIHEGLTSDSDSLHITVGIISYTWVDIFNEAISLIKTDPAFRESLPPGYISQEGGLPAEKFAALLQKFNEAANLDKLTGKIADRFISSRRPLLDGQLNQLRLLDSLDANSPLERRPGILCKLEPGDNAVSLVYTGKRVAFPGFVENTLRFILRQEGRSFTVSDLPDELDEAGRLVLVRRLVKEGFLSIVSGE